MFLQDKDNSVQVSFKSGRHSLTPVLANVLNLSLFSFLIIVIQNILAKYLYLIWVCWHCKYIVNKNQKWDLFRVMKTFIRKKMGHTT